MKRWTTAVALAVYAALAWTAEPAEVNSQPQAASDGQRTPDAAEPPAAPAAATPSATPASQLPAGPQTAARRADRLDLDTTVVTGNRELPKVLYIVPWKKADLGDLPAQPFNTLLDEVLTPVDRDVFRREVTYYKAVSSGGNASAAPQSASSDGTEK